MHPLAAPGTLWVLSSDGKYLVRPQADETSHKKQISDGRQGKSLPCFPRITKDFASAEATKGLSGRPLDPFGAHPCMRGRNLPQETDSLWQAGKEPSLLSTHHRGFRLSGGDQRAFRSPFGNLRPFAAHGGFHKKQIPCGRQETGLPFFFRITKAFASAEATRGLSGRSATSIGAAFRRLFRLRKAGMLSRHWRLCLPFPLPPSGPHLQNLTQAAEPLPPGAFHRLSSFIPLWSVPIPPLLQDAS